jgi:hypothetical protein
LSRGCGKAQDFCVCRQRKIEKDESAMKKASRILSSEKTYTNILNISTDKKSPYRIIETLGRPRIMERHRPVHLYVLSFITHGSKADTAEIVIFFPATKKKKKKEEIASIQQPSSL